MNCLSRKIGIYYTDLEWRDEYFKRLLENIPPEAISKVMNKYETFIQLKDGTTIKFVKVNDGAKANKFHEVFLQLGISYEEYYKIIAPCFIGNGQGYFVNKLEDFYFRKEAARTYFNRQNEKES